MVVKLNRRILERDITDLLRNSLIEQFNYVKNKEKPTDLDIKHLAYHAIAYFQYLNILRKNQAVELYIDYILSDGQKDKIVDVVYYIDGFEKKAKKNEIVIPLYFDDLLKDISKYLMNFKGIVVNILIDSYTKYFRKKYHLNPSDITLYAMINLLEDLRLNSLIALNKHWTIINKEILPFLLQKAQVVQTKN
jgi:hypothetical protein